MISFRRIEQPGPAVQLKRSRRTRYNLHPDYFDVCEDDRHRRYVQYLT